jgi:hypothetical protein
MTVSLVPLEQLTPAPWNPRHIDKTRLKNLAESIKADPNFLLRRPILAQTSGEIYAGNQRWHAAKLLFAQGWTPPWQTQTGLLGFDDRELSQLLTRLGGPELNPDDADLTLPVEPVTKPGDLWILGEHRLLCGDAFLESDHDVVLDADPYLANGLGSRPDSVILAVDREGVEGHPVPKPLAVWEWFLERGTRKPGQVVFDPFAGSGTTLIAAEKLGRRARAIEISPAYCDVAVRRWERVSGRQAYKAHA